MQANELAARLYLFCEEEFGQVTTPGHLLTPYFRGVNNERTIIRQKLRELLEEAGFPDPNREDEANK
jgi:hypothetical protein